MNKNVIFKIIFNSLVDLSDNNKEAKVFFHNYIIPYIKMNEIIQSHYIVDPNDILNFIKYAKEKSNISIWSNINYDLLYNNVKEFLDISGY